MKTEKKFDAVAMKREIQERLAREFAALTPEERAKSARFQWLGSNADAYLADWQATWDREQPECLETLRGPV